MRFLLYAAAWLIFITLLHTWFGTEQVRTEPGKASVLKVGFLPITCHLLCPVAHARLQGSPDEFEAVKFTSWPDMIDAVRGGEIDMAFILAPIAITLREQGVPVKIVLLGHRDGTALVVSKASGINSVADLAGKRVAIPIRFSTQNMELLALCRKANVDIKTMSIFELPPPDMPSALASGGIDAYIVGEPYAAQAELAGSGRVLVQMRDAAPGFISSVLIVREPVMHEQHARVARLISHFAAQAPWIESHRKEAADMGAEAYGLPPSLIEYVLLSSKDRVSYRDIIPRPGELGEIASEMVKLGLLPHAPSGNELVDISWRQDVQTQ